MNRRIRNIATALALVLVTAATTVSTVDLWQQEDGIILLFGTLGADSAPDRNPQFFRNAQGQDFFTFDNSNGTGRGRWQRFDEPNRKRAGVPARVWINGWPFTFHADSTVTGAYLNADGLEATGMGSKLQVWLTPPVEFSIAVQDSLWRDSGPIFFAMNDCSPDSGTVIPPRPDPILPEARYRVKIEKDGEPFLDGRTSSLTYDHYGLDQNDYTIWFSLVDSLGMGGHWIGPVNVIAGECDE